MTSRRSKAVRHVGLQAHLHATVVVLGVIMDSTRGSSPDGIEAAFRFGVCRHNWVGSWPFITREGSLEHVLVSGVSSAEQALREENASCVRWHHVVNAPRSCAAHDGPKLFAMGGKIDLDPNLSLESVQDSKAKAA